MRRLVALSLLCLAAAPLTAAPIKPGPGDARSPDCPDRPESQVFAQQLFTAVNQVAAGYVRPVSRAALAHAALAGLYDAARRPVPAKLKAKVEDADANETLLLLFRRVAEDVAGAEALRGRNPVLVACQAMARSLDPYTDVVLASEQQRTLGLEGEGCGVGLEVGGAGGAALPVQAVHPGAPAQRAGLRPGDEILRLDCRDVSDLSADKVQELLGQGPPDPDALDAPTGPVPPLALVYRRPGTKETTKVVLEPERYRVEAVLGVRRDDYNAWDYWLDADRHLAHLRLTQLSRGAALELREVVTRLKDAGLEGLILDLRWCPGGYLDEAVDVARLFLGEGVIATVRARNRPDAAHRGDGRRAIRDVPLVVLVNGDTMGGAELIAAALQDYRRAAVVGQRTRGKASVQTPIHLGVPQAGMKLTSGTFLRPSGRNLHRFPDSRADDDWGVRPDVEFRISTDLDARLKAWWQTVTLRPGGSTERIPLDTPGADPCQTAALEALRDRMRQPRPVPPVFAAPKEEAGTSE